MQISRFFGCVMLTAKALVLYLFSHETARGEQRIEETRHRSLFSLLGEYRSVFGQVLRSKPILAALALMIITNIFGAVHGSFWGVLFTTKLGFAESQISLYVIVILLLVTSPFPWIAGQLSAIDRALPFALNMGLFVIGAGLVWLIGRQQSFASLQKE